MTQEEILAQQAAQKALEGAAQQAAAEAAAKKGVTDKMGVTTAAPSTPATPAQSSATLGFKGSLLTPEAVTTATQPVIPKVAIVPWGGGFKGEGGQAAPAKSTTAPITTTKSDLAPQTQTTQTPYGQVAVTRPQGAPEVPNALAKERSLLDRASTDTMPKVPVTAGKTARDLQQNLEQSAQTYRDLVSANASPEQRAAAKQNYANALESKFLLARQEGGAPPGRSRPMQETGAITASQAFGAPQRVVSPAEQERIAHYNKVITGMGVNPYQIGTAEMNAKGGLNVMPIREETAINTMADKAAKTYRDLQRIEHDARQALKETTQQGKRGGKKEGQTAAQEAAKTRLMEAQLATEEFGLKSGAVDPGNPTAGVNIDNIRRTVTAARALGRDPSSLSGVAQEQIAQKATGQKKEEPKKELAQADRQAAEMAEITERNRVAAEEWYRDLERRKQAALGQGQYAYNY